MEKDEPDPSEETPPVSEGPANDKITVSAGEQDRDGTSHVTVSPSDDVNMAAAGTSGCSRDLDETASASRINSTTKNGCDTVADDELVLGESPTVVEGSDSAGEEAVRFKRLKLSHRRSYRSHEEGAALQAVCRIRLDLDPV